MDITPEQRDEMYENASEAIQRLYSSAESGELMEAVFKKNVLPEEKYKTYAITIGNVILGFYPISELSNQLAANLGIDNTIAKNITADLIDFLSPVLKEQENTQTVFTPPEKVGSAVPQPTQPNTPPQQPPAAHTDAAATQTPETTESAVGSIRTMEQDMDRVHGYGAYRKLNPEIEANPEVRLRDESLSRTSGSSVPNNLPQANAPVGYEQAIHQAEQTIKALSQEEMLKRPPLAKTPSYTDKDTPQQ